MIHDHLFGFLIVRVFFLLPFDSDEKKLIQKQMAFMLARQQIFLELDENMDEYDELVEIMSNAHLNNNFLSLAREVSSSSVWSTSTLNKKNNCKISHPNEPFHYL